MTDTDSVLIPGDRSLNYLNRIIKRPTLNVEFENLKYFIRDPIQGDLRKSKLILNSISGKFSCGEFTAILGPSGAGKTTLLNALAGYVNKGVQGDIKINNTRRNLAAFSKTSSYIMQENFIQLHLSVREAMTYAARFKLESEITEEEKSAMVEEIMYFLGLEKCKDILGKHLSGGEKKRLAIALELVHNPPVIFLDEPTTGLDDYSVKNCIDLLKKISRLNRTIVCTIHQPSSLVLHCFDQVYIMTNGSCIYNGSPDQLVPFLLSTGHSCPTNYNPAEYLIELISSSSSSKTVEGFTQAIKNGKINIGKTNREIPHTVVEKYETDFPISYSAQVTLLLSRMFLQIKRNRTPLFIQLFSYLIFGVCLGCVFYGSGNNATQGLLIFKFCVAVVVVLSFTFAMAPTMQFPSEIPLLKQEYFNRWYSIKAYYTALTLVNLITLFISGTIFIIVIYFISDQPMEIDRFVGFYLVSLMIAMVSQASGYFVASILKETPGGILTSLYLGYMLLLGIHGLGYKATFPPIVDFMKALSFMKFGFAGLARALGWKRPPLLCKEEEEFCYYTRLMPVLERNGMPMQHYAYDMCYICVFFVVFHVLSYLSLQCRLNFEFSSGVAHFVKRLFRGRM